jgi:crotonobetainyl-CoA:carnitine CoA-transferase CaiB-like acyl-CoA transferase
MTVERKISPAHEAPYRGLRVQDFGQGVASSFCAMLLCVYGADIIKVEPPEGDWSRYLGSGNGSHTALSADYNRGKRCRR